MELMKWCSENNVGKEDLIIIPLRFMTPHKLMRYASEQFAAHRKKSYSSVGYYSMGDLLSDYKDYLLTCPLSSRHFLWTPVMQHKHNGLPSGFVLS